MAGSGSASFPGRPCAPRCSAISGSRCWPATSATGCRRSGLSGCWSMVLTRHARRPRADRPRPAAVLFALASGALADTFDRRRLLVAVRPHTVAVGASHRADRPARMPPSLLLTFTFALGIGQPCRTGLQRSSPTWSPARRHAASALGSISQNLARAIGPAMAGVLIAHTGVGAVFGLNTVRFLLYASWSRRSPSWQDLAESRTVHRRGACRRPVHAPLARRAAHPAAGGPVPGPGQRTLGTAAPDRDPPARPGLRRVRHPAGRGRRGRGGRRGPAAGAARPLVGEPGMLLVAGAGSSSRSSSSSWPWRARRIYWSS